MDLGAQNTSALIGTLLGFGGGGVTVGGIAWWFFSRWIARMQDDLKQFQQKELKELSDRIGKVEQNQKCAVHTEKLETFEKWLNKVEGKLDRVLLKTAKTEGFLGRHETDGD